MVIERKFVAQKVKEFQVQQYVSSMLTRVGHSKTKLQKTPLGDKIVVHASRPGLVVGRGGKTITTLTEDLKKRFDLENPQIKLNEVENVNLDANIVAERIINSLERFGTAKFKGIGHRALQDVMDAGALGVEILITGRIPGSRAKRWRFYQGYLKKCGDVAVEGVHTAIKVANLKIGSVGVQVKIMPQTTVLPDKVDLIKESKPATVEVEEEDVEEITEHEEKKEEKKPRKKVAKKAKKTKKAAKKKEDKKEEKHAKEKKEEIKEEKTEEKHKEKKPKESSEEIKEVVVEDEDKKEAEE